MTLPDVPDLKLIKERLPIIFPEGIENRNYVIREMAAKTIFVMFYVGAVEGSEVYVRPDQVTKMTDEVSLKLSEAERIEWRKNSLTPGKMKDVPNCWYAANTREPIRDETLRSGLIQLGAVIERGGLPTTSSKPRYALKKSFAELFESRLGGLQLSSRIKGWQDKSLSTGALARLKLIRKGAVASEIGKEIQVKFPNGETRKMAAGPSSVISKAVIEEFVSRFLKKPGVIFLSESGNKVVSRDDELATAIGLKIEADKNLPDIILVDVEPENPLIVFVEVVATDGPINQMRKDALLDIALKAGFHEEQVAFVTAFMDKTSIPYRKLSAVLAWGTFAWFASEPDNIVILKGDINNHKEMLYELI
ncbi:MAG: restriction endonuclease [bacterium]|nr:restriction endonuclease [bacterium]